MSKQIGTRSWPTSPPTAAPPASRSCTGPGSPPGEVELEGYNIKHNS